MQLMQQIFHSQDTFIHRRHECFTCKKRWLVGTWMATNEWSQMSENNFGCNSKLAVVVVVFDNVFVIIIIIIWFHLLRQRRATDILRRWTVLFDKCVYLVLFLFLLVCLHLQHVFLRCMSNCQQFSKQLTLNMVWYAHKLDSKFTDV